MNRTLRSVVTLATILTFVSCVRDERGAASQPATLPDSNPAATNAPDTPEGLVGELYTVHTANRGPFFQTASRALVDDYFEQTLAELIWSDALVSHGEVGAIDFDPLYDAQDTDFRNVVVERASGGRDRARVVVSFDSGDARRQVTYSLAALPSGWRISDIEYGEGRTLRGMLLARN
jgi:hypothetical protein